MTSYEYIKWQFDNGLRTGTSLQFLISGAVTKVDWLQALKQFFINVSSYTYSQSNSDGCFITEPSELDWLQGMIRHIDDKLF